MRYEHGYSCREVKLGDIVRISQHPQASTYMVKRIDTLNEEIYIVVVNDNAPFGQWISVGSIFLA